MKVIKEGYKYEVSNLDNKDSQGQIIQFIEKGQIFKHGESELVTINDGTSSEELIGVLIHRLEFLNEKVYSIENLNALDCLDDAMKWLNKRTSSRIKRNVEGTISE